LKPIEKKFKIRPAARHILTIGRDLIKDSMAALIELVKNSYDADADRVGIKFEVPKNSDSLKIIVEDTGHGMSFDTVVNKWMIPSTADKLKRRYSPGGRLMQGRKGIGRYAAAILGDEMFMESVDSNFQKTQVYIDWREFEVDVSSEAEKYLDEIEILIENLPAIGVSNGTRIEIVGKAESLSEWPEENVDLFVKELRKLMSPLMEVRKEDKFDIFLSFENFPVKKYHDVKIKIEPFGIIELFDYRLSGVVKKEKLFNLDIDNFPEKNKFRNAYELAAKSDNDFLIIADYIYENKSAPGIPQETFMDVISLSEGGYCGEIKFDIRVFDREAESIENLIKKGLMDPYTHEYLGKREARRLLDEMSGVSIYRGGFRIRPYGEPGYDWLQLDKRRVQDPTVHIGSDQIISIVTIQSEEDSFLEEKSARDGLKENKYYAGLKDIMIQVLQKLEYRRNQFRIKTGKGRKLLKIDSELQKLSDLYNLEQKLLRVLEQAGVDEKNKNKITKVIRKTREDTGKTVEEFRDIISRYEGHVTLGKIIMVLMHEGRKPLSYFKDQVPNLLKYINMIGKEDFEYVFSQIEEITNGLVEQADFFIRLFKRLNPLAVRKRRKRKFRLKSAIEKASKVFESELLTNEIGFSVQVDEKIVFHGWEEDFYIILTNLFENSIYWLKQSYKDEKIIRIKTSIKAGKLFLDFVDNGPGIEKIHIEGSRIFEPGFSTKKNGTGLGLPISGEAASRNNGEIEAIYNEHGAHLRCTFKLEETSK
jgi:signal transduction histidine kinase